MTSVHARPQKPLFDAYLMVDWSANSKAKSGKDSIWYFLLRRTPKSEKTVGPFNPSTRRAAVKAIQELLEEQATNREKTLVGFDFPYGYPAGFAAALCLKGEPWRAVWTKLSSLIEDNANNESNRFETAGLLNNELGPAKGTFWACPTHKKSPDLPTHKPKPWGIQVEGIPRHRQVATWAAITLEALRSRVGRQSNPARYPLFVATSERSVAEIMLASLAFRNRSERARFRRILHRPRGDLSIFGSCQSEGQ